MGKEKIFYGWYIVAACFLLSMLFAGSGFYSFSIFIKPIEDDFGWNRGAISLTMSIFLVTSGIAGPIAGRFIERFGPRKVMYVCAIGAGASYLLVSLTFSLWYFYLAYALLAIMASGIGIIPVSTLMARWFSDLRGTATGIAMVGISTGGLILAPVVGIITLHFGWKAAFVFIGLTVWLVAIPIVHFVIKDKPEEIGLSPDGKAGEAAPSPGVQSSVFHVETGHPAPEVFRSGDFWFIFTSFFLVSFAQMGILQHQVPMLVDIKDVTQATATMALGLTAGFGGVGKLTFGRLADTWQFRYVVLLCFGLQGLAVAMLLYIGIPGVIWIYTVVFGFSMGGVIVLMALVVARFWGLIAYGVLIGALWIAISLGGALGTFVNGLAYDYLSSYRLPLNFFLGAYFLSIISFFLAGKSKRKDQDHAKN